MAMLASVSTRITYSLSCFMPYSTLSLYFENSVGRVLENPKGYLVVEYHPGPRKFSDLQALLTHAGQALTRHGWHKLLGDQRLLAPFTPEESKWITEHWLTAAQLRTNTVYGAVLLPHDVFARLSVSQLINDSKAAAMTYRLFEDLKAAEAWLLQTP
jgi:hypothetical protein